MQEKVFIHKETITYRHITQKETNWFSSGAPTTTKSCGKQMIELEAPANDPDRFINCGGQLLMEEKERRMIARRLGATSQYELGRTVLKEGFVFGDSLSKVLRRIPGLQTLLFVSVQCVKE